MTVKETNRRAFLKGMAVGGVLAAIGDAFAGEPVRIGIIGAGVRALSCSLRSQVDQGRKHG